MTRSIDPYKGTVADYFDPASTNLLDRWNLHQLWWDQRLSHGVDPFSKTTIGRIGTRCAATYRGGAPIAGVNFASQDYLNLASHPAVVTALQEAAGEFGVHSAGSAALMGVTKSSLDLEAELSDFLQLADCSLFSTGWGAGYGVVRALARPGDHIVIDVLAHACLQEGAKSSGAEVSHFPHASTPAVERRLQRIRDTQPRAGILVVTESVFSMDSDVPDLSALQELCHRYNATLVVDVAHDLGALGESGLGQLEMQGVVGQLDIVMGSFSKTFASNGGFVATNHRALKLALRYNCGPMTFTNAMSPVSAAVVRKALAVVRSAEGLTLRRNLGRNIGQLRNGLTAAGFEVLGQPSPIIPVVLGDAERSRHMTRHTIAAGAIVNLVEYPAVAKNRCRWRLQAMARHSPADIQTLLDVAIQARDATQDHEQATAGV